MQTSKVSKLVASFTLEFLAGHWNPSIWAESLHLEHLPLFWCAPLTSNHFLCWCGTWELSLPCCLWFDCLDLRDDFFFLHFPAGNSVHWCLSRLISTACGAPATCFIWHTVALELSIHFASCHTLLAGNLSKSTLPSLIVLDTNLHHIGKTRKYPCARSWLFLGVIWPDWLVLALHCTIHLHSCCLV